MWLLFFIFYIKQQQQQKQTPLGGRGGFMSFQEMEKVSDKSTKPKPKRVRVDTFSFKSDEEIAARFQKIFDGMDEEYELKMNDQCSKKDIRGQTRNCWRLYSKKTNEVRDTLNSTKTYRHALLWASRHPSYLKKSKREHLESKLSEVQGKRGLHSRHRCGNDWCCNPGHFLIGERKENEVDKCYHYFLNNSDPTVRDRFMKAFPDLLRKEKLF